MGIERLKDNIRIFETNYNVSPMERILEIVKIKQETYDVKTFRLKLDKKLEFIPGQYCIVSFVDEKYPDNEKPFTFASSPTQEDYVELTIKKVCEFTSALHSLEEGEKLRIDGPRGESLNFDESVKDDTVFIAGGSGITPFMSSLRYAVDKNLPNNLTLLFSNQTVDDIIYHKELNEMRKKDNIKVINTLTREKPENWYGEEGRIDKEMIQKHISELSKKLWYVCAPPPMVKAMKKILLELNIPEDTLRIEDWQIPGKHDQGGEKCG